MEVFKDGRRTDGINGRMIHPDGADQDYQARSHSNDQAEPAGSGEGVLGSCQRSAFSYQPENAYALSG